MRPYVLLSLCSLTVVVSAQSSSLPACGKTCLLSSQSASTSCSSSDIHCLCSDPTFVNAFSCCLSTQCSTADQAASIQWDEQWCMASNASAPAFAGCSPISISTSVAAGGSTVTSFVVAGKSTSANTQYVVSTVETVPGSYTNTKITTASFVGQPLYTGICTAPFFALAGSGNAMTLYPEVGCAPDRPSCCAVDINADAGITKCPQDYFTTASGCCPLGYQVYYTNIGLETPCYSSPAMALVPATTVATAGITVVTDHVFSKKYTLVPAPGYKFPVPGIIGITVNAVLFVVIIIAVIWRRRVKAERARQAAAASTFPPVEPTLPNAERAEHMDKAGAPSELASPEMRPLARPPSQYQQPWPLVGSSPPAYEGDRARPPIVSKSFGPQELPGSTYIHERYRPGAQFSVSEASSDTSPKTPPGRSPVLSASSPGISPAPAHGDGRPTSEGGFVSPPGSPGVRKT